MWEASAICVFVLFVIGIESTALKDKTGHRTGIDSVPVANELSYNPVLQNTSVLLDFLRTKKDTAQTNNTKNSREKRSSHRRNCSGLCEQSLCPWREVWHEERGRLPQFIKYAVCDSQKCNFDFAGSVNTMILEIETHCDVVTTDIRTTTASGHEKWLREWPIACACTQRTIAMSNSRLLQLAHPGKDGARLPTVSSSQVNVDIAENNNSLAPVSRQRIVLSGVPHYKPLSRKQKSRLRKQQRRMQNSETWAQVLARRHNKP